jgi:N-acyl-D-amino-acid deacylase
MYDIIIREGTIIDGSGNRKFSADIGIKEGVITAIGDLGNEMAHKTIDARGKVVSPGFIDVNNHSDTYWRIFSDPLLGSLICQGVTTIMGGNCGSSLAPLASKDVIKTIQKWADVRTINLNWLTMKEFLDEVEKKKLAVNFASLVGHATLRRGLLGDEVRDVSPAEVATMKKMLKQAFKEGAFGFSTGLVYTHAKHASSLEIDELVEVVKKNNGVYTTHVRGEGEDLIPSIEEAIRVAQHSGVRLHISHLKAMGQKNWPLMEKALSLIENAHMDGVEIYFDVYPYTSTGSVLYILLPDWVTEGGRQMMLARLKDENIRRDVIAEMRASGFDFSKITVSISSLDKTLSKKNVIDIAKAQGKTVEETIIDLLIASEGRVVTMMHVLSEKNVDKAVQNQFSIIASNGSGYPIEHAQTGELVHPRNFGTFPRVLAKYVCESGVIGWEEAIHKMSGRPAKVFGIEKRGILKVGNYADVVVIDPDNIKDMATVDNPYQYSQGINWVIVNGEVAIEDGKNTHKRSGMVLRKKSSWFSF